MIRVDIEPDAPSGVEPGSARHVGRSLDEGLEAMAVAMDVDTEAVAALVAEALIRRAAFERLKRRYDVRRFRSKP